MMDTIPGVRMMAAGGSLEPAGRSAARPAARVVEPPGELYELRERETGVIHRSASFSEMAAKAQALHSELFVAVAPDGRRTSIHRVDDRWERGPQRPASSVRSGAEPVQAALALPTPSAKAAPAARAAGETASAGAPAVESAASTLRAERAARVARLEAELLERYVIRRAPVSLGPLSLGRTEYRFKGDSTRVAFTESTFRLATDTNSPSVARSMVDVAETRQWKALRVTGHPEFQRQVWLEATARGFKALGYEPTVEDVQQAQRQREERLVNRIEAAPALHAKDTTPSSAKSSERGGGRKAVLAAVEAVLVAQKMPEGQRAAIMAAAAENLASRSRRGQEHRVRIYDRAGVNAPGPARPEFVAARERTIAAPER